MWISDDASSCELSSQGIAPLELINEDADDNSLSIENKEAHFYFSADEAGNHA